MRKPTAGLRSGCAACWPKGKADAERAARILAEGQRDGEQAARQAAEAEAERLREVIRRLRQGQGK